MSDKENTSEINIAEMTKIMLRELSWKAIKEILSANEAGLTTFQRGGFDLDRKNRSRAEKILGKKIGTKNEKEIFFKWYEEQEKYTRILNSYVSKKELGGSSEKVDSQELSSPLKDEDYENLIRIIDCEHAKLFLYFCPELFSEKQKERVQDISVESRSNSSKLRATAAMAPEIIEKLKAELKEARSEQKKLERDYLEARATIENYKKEISRAVKKSRDQEALIKKYRIQMDNRIDEQVLDISEELNRYKEDLSKAHLDANDCKAKYEKAVQQIEAKLSENVELRKQIAEIKDRDNARFCRILERIDLQGIILSLNEPDDVKERLSAFVKPQSTDDPMSKEKEAGALKSCWDRMIRCEIEMMGKICRMDVAEINYGFYKNWAKHTDDFNDLIYSLRARAILVKMIHEVLWQNR